MRSTPLRVIGVDPGLRRCGWGVIDVDGPSLRHVADGTVEPRGDSLGPRLAQLHAGLAEVIARHAPAAAALEMTFVNKDGQGTLKLGQARGVALLALAQAGLEVGEYQPNTVKKTVVGAGQATRPWAPRCRPPHAGARGRPRRSPPSRSGGGRDRRR